MVKVHPATQLEYGAHGLIGCLTPQANTTVEPEFNILLPTGYALLNARLTSSKDSIEARLIDYAETLEQQQAQFANAPLQALAFATTGASYLLGRVREDALVERMQRRHDGPLVTAARAVCDALSILSAKRIALISPYPPALTASSVEYWHSRGFEVVRVHSVYDDSDAFHPIYALRAGASTAALSVLRTSGVDAIVILGTGLPSLRAIAACAGWEGPPLLSCMFCLAWRGVLVAGGDEPDAAQLQTWLSASHWHARLQQVAGPEFPHDSV